MNRSSSSKSRSVTLELDGEDIFLQLHDFHEALDALRLAEAAFPASISIQQQGPQPSSLQNSLRCCRRNAHWSTRHGGPLVVHAERVQAAVAVRLMV